MTKIKIWYPEKLFDKNQRNSWFELIKSKERFERKQNQIDGIIQNQIEWVDSADSADVYVLPQDWGYYYSINKQVDAIKFCKEAFKKGVTVLSNSGGDQGITVPVPKNTIVYRQSGYKSKKKNNERTAPFFLSDPVLSLNQAKESELFITTKSELPVVGFCGMAPHGVITKIKEWSQIILRNIKSVIGLSFYDRQAIISSSNLRHRTLSIFKSTKLFKTNYLIREKYRGGVQTKENRAKTTREYYQNQINSDLIVCVRGVGNFSLRFFETIAMGRIPIFIDTDSPLPDISPLNWNDYIISIDKNDLENAASLSDKWLENKDIVEQQRKNRQLWQDHFRLDSFWIRELQILDKL